MRGCFGRKEKQQGSFSGSRKGRFCFFRGGGGKKRVGVPPNGTKGVGPGRRKAKPPGEMGGGGGDKGGVW